MRDARGKNEKWVKISLGMYLIEANRRQGSGQELTMPIFKP